ncbi:MAG: deoxyuridine 5'-triphosphate nucleotidohydrolase [Methanocellales archaeon]
MNAVLNSKEIKKLLIKQNPPLIENYIDLEQQLQSNGFDLTVQKVEALLEKGEIAFENTQRKIPRGEKLEFDGNDWLFLPRGCYRIILNEVVNIPNNLIAIGKPRSSLIRCGATIETAFWDAGYSGRSEVLLVVFNEYGLKLKRNARIMQLIFLRIDEVEKGYSGIYQREHIN